jgi:hypothetical protein
VTQHARWYYDSVRAGAGRIVSGRPVSELTSGDDDGGDGYGDGEEVWAEINAGMGGEDDAGCCRLVRRDLYLGCGWGLTGLTFDTRRSASITISISLSESICLCSSEGSLARPTRRRFSVAGHRCEYMTSFPVLPGDTRGVTGEWWFSQLETALLCAFVRVCFGFGDVMMTSTLPLSLEDSALVSPRSRRVLPLTTGGP